MIQESKVKSGIPWNLGVEETAASVSEVWNSLERKGSSALAEVCTGCVPTQQSAKETPVFCLFAACGSWLPRQDLHFSLGATGEDGERDLQAPADSKANCGVCCLTSTCEGPSVKLSKRPIAPMATSVNPIVSELYLSKTGTTL